jgi:uncharacterized protein DUF3471
MRKVSTVTFVGILAVVFIASITSCSVTSMAQESKDSSAKGFDRFVGKYELAPNFFITISTEGGSIFAQASGQGKHEIFPEPDSDKKFFYKVVKAQIEFVSNGQGNVTELILYQNGVKHAKKISGEAPGFPKEVDVAQDILNTYIGKYSLTPSVIIEISVDGGNIFSQLTGQPKIRIYPESESKYFYKVVAAQITFVKDSGAVTKLILHQNGDHEAEKVE